MDKKNVSEKYIDLTLLEKEKMFVFLYFLWFEMLSLLE